MFLYFQMEKDTHRHSTHTQKQRRKTTNFPYICICNMVGSSNQYIKSMLFLIQFEDHLAKYLAKNRQIFAHMFIKLDSRLTKYLNIVK